MINRNSEPPNQSSDDRIDPGEPIQELSEFSVTLPPDFVGRLMRIIDRRILSNELLDCGRLSIVEIFKEYWTLFISIITNKKKK